MREQWQPGDPLYPEPVELPPLTQADISGSVTSARWPVPLPIHDLDRMEADTDAQR